MIVGKIISLDIKQARKRRFFEITINDGSGTLKCIWFRGLSWISEKFSLNETIAVYGKIEFYNGFRLIHPEFDMLDDNEDPINTGKIISIYPSNTDLITDATGRIEGSFIIPSTAALKFKTGTREFRLTDSSTNNKNNEITFAEALYHAQGLLEVKENTIISTKVPRFVTSETNSSRVISETTTRSTKTEKIEYIDPVAQTFLITQQGGMFTTKLDLFVQAKDESIPLNVSIRSVENGIPTQQVVPGTDVVVYPGSITTSADGSSATTVTFDHPVYLAQDQEYAIVLISQSDDYKVFIAETGGFDLQNTANRVTKQPYNGVFFTSANASTWTPEQTKDLKFTLFRANFTSTSANIIMTNDAVQPRALKNNPFEYVSTSGGNSIVKVTHPNHGMYGANNKVTIGGQSGTVNNITAAQMNSTCLLYTSPSPRDS